MGWYISYSIKIRERSDRDKDDAIEKRIDKIEECLFDLKKMVGERVTIRSYEVNCSEIKTAIAEINRQLIRLVDRTGRQDRWDDDNHVMGGGK